jgi:hypothetical protein
LNEPKIFQKDGAEADCSVRYFLLEKSVSNNGASKARLSVLKIIAKTAKGIKGRANFSNGLAKDSNRK